MIKKEDLIHKRILTPNEKTHYEVVRILEKIGFKPLLNDKYAMNKVIVCTSLTTYCRSSFTEKHEQKTISLEDLKIIVGDRKFKVGDKVRLLGTKGINSSFKCMQSWHNSHNKKIPQKGDIGIILSTNHDTTNMMVRLFDEEKYNGSWEFLSSDIELVNDKNQETNKLNFDYSDLYPKTDRIYIRNCALIINKNEGETKMELKELNKSSIKEAKKQFDTERQNAEIEFAKRQLRDATDEKMRIERLEKKYLEEISKLKEEMSEKYKEIMTLL